MYVVFIKNYKKKALFSCLILTLWVFAYLLTNIIINNSFLLRITINNCLTFSCPFNFNVDNIYINEQYGGRTIETSLPFNKPRTEKFTKFTSPEGNFSFDYPSIFTLSQQEFAGSEILYHIDLKSKSSPIHGFVQVWNLPHPLKEFLDQSKSASQLQYKSFNSIPVSVNNLQGYFWDYSFLSNSGNSIKGNEVFLQKDETMYRISYFVPEELWGKEQSETFWKIVKSFKPL